MGGTTKNPSFEWGEERLNKWRGKRQARRWCWAVRGGCGCNFLGF
jgi:hypothetical protein